MQVTEPLPIALANAEDLASWVTPYLATEPVVAEKALLELRRLRDALRAALVAHTAHLVTTRGLAALNALVDAHLAVHHTLVAARGRVGSARISTGPNGPSLLLSDVCLAIVELFGSAKAARIKQCANDACTRFFLDASKSGTRTWCDMKTCGNRAKAARFYERRVSSASSD